MDAGTWPGVLQPQPRFVCVQVGEALERASALEKEDIRIETVLVETRGDVDKTSSLRSLGSGAFTGEVTHKQRPSCWLMEWSVPCKAGPTPNSRPGSPLLPRALLSGG